MNIDLYGLEEIPSMGGAMCVLSIIEDYSRKLWVFLLKNIDETLEKFEEWRFLIENKIGMKAKNFMIEYGLEFCGEAFVG